MKKFRLRDYLPVLIMVLCAAIFGVLLATGVMDLDTVPQLVADRPVLAVLVVLGLYVLKGFSGVVVYNALVVVVSMVLPLPAALAVNGVGTAVCLSISYAMGRFTKTESLESVLDRHPKIKRYFSATQEYGFAWWCAAWCTPCESSGPPKLKGRSGKNRGLPNRLWLRYEPKIQAAV